MNIILEPLHYDFMIRAMIAGSIVALIAPMLGAFLVVRRYSLMADTLSHVALAGIALGVVLHAAPLPVALVAVSLAALGIERLRTSGHFEGDAVLAVVLSSSLAVAFVLFSAARSASFSVLSFLFGSITTVSRIDVWTVVVIGMVVLAMTILLFRQLFSVAFDEQVARVHGLHVTLLNQLFVVLVAMMIVLSLRIVGGLLVGALIVIPILTAGVLTQSFRSAIGFGILFAFVAVIIGLYLAFWLNIPAGGAIVITALAEFLCAVGMHRHR